MYGNSSYLLKNIINSYMKNCILCTDYIGLYITITNITTVKQKSSLLDYLLIGG